VTAARGLQTLVGLTPGVGSLDTWDTGGAPGGACWELWSMLEEASGVRLGRASWSASWRAGRPIGRMPLLAGEGDEVPEEGPLTSSFPHSLPFSCVASHVHSYPSASHSSSASRLDGNDGLLSAGSLQLGTLPFAPMAGCLLNRMLFVGNSSQVDAHRPFVCRQLVDKKGEASRQKKRRPSLCSQQRECTGRRRKRAARLSRPGASCASRVPETRASLRGLVRLPVSVWQ